MNSDKITYGLPKKIEKMLLDGLPIAKCRKLLKEFPGYEDKSTKELTDILMTAHTYLMAESTAQQFEREFEYYQVSPVIDESTCEYCKNIAKMKFKFSEREPGKNFPPLHNGCRCSITVSVENWDKWMDNYVARNITQSPQETKVKLSNFRYNKTILLCTIFGGWFGLHRYMRKQIGMGILYTFTAGLFLIGWFVDIAIEASRPKK